MYLLKYTYIVFHMECLLEYSENLMEKHYKKMWQTVNFKRALLWFTYWESIITLYYKGTGRRLGGGAGSVIVYRSQFYFSVHINFVIFKTGSNKACRFAYLCCEVMNTNVNKTRIFSFLECTVSLPLDLSSRIFCIAFVNNANIPSPVLDPKWNRFQYTISVSRNLQPVWLYPKH